MFPLSIHDERDEAERSVVASAVAALRAFGDAVLRLSLRRA
jgi:hypothetical protein